MSENSSENSNNRAPHLFKEGQSGNPGGRPKIAVDFKEKCRSFMEEGGWDSLMEVVNNPKHKDRVRTLELIAGYAYGKPSQGVEHTGQIGVRLIDDIPGE